MTVTNGDMVKRYLELRDYIEREDQAHVERMKPFKDGKTAIEGMLAIKLESEAEKNIKTEYGTAFFANKMSVKVADKPKLQTYIIVQIAEASKSSDFGKAQTAISLLGANVSKDELANWMAAHGEDVSPLGIELTYFKQVQIRRT